MIVCNSSVLIALSLVHKLGLLKKKCRGEKLIIPKAVWKEVVEEGEGRPGAIEIANADWIKVEEVQNQDIVKILLTQIDHGEAEAITLALEKKANLILLDEKEAREIAQRLGLKVIGTIGLFVWAKREGFIGTVKEYLDALQNDAGFRLNPELYKQVLIKVDELKNNDNEQEP